jgi:hypothetical protein
VSTLITFETAAGPRQHGLRPVTADGNARVDRTVLFAGRAECPSCSAFLLRVSAHGEGDREVVAGWCNVCCTTTYFAPTS